MSEDIIVTRRDGVVTATLNRPQARNALTYAMYDELAALCRAVDADAAVRVLVLTGAGGAFAAGTDIAQFDALRTAADSLAYEARIETTLRALEECRVPTIAAMAGACTGGGAMIAACCDLRLADETLRFGVPIAKTLGNCLSSQNLARLVALLGEPRVKAMIFTARLMTAGEAQAAGLVVDVVPPAALATRAAELAEAVATAAPLTLRATKSALGRIRPAVPGADDLVTACYTSEDFREGVAAFNARRKPVWRGR